MDPFGQRRFRKVEPAVARNGWTSIRISGSSRRPTSLFWRSRSWFTNRCKRIALRRAISRLGFSPISSSSRSSGSCRECKRSPKLVGDHPEESGLLLVNLRSRSRLSLSSSVCRSTSLLSFSWETSAASRASLRSRSRSVRRTLIWSARPAANKSSAESTPISMGCAQTKKLYPPRILLTHCRRKHNQKL